VGISEEARALTTVSFLLALRKYLLSTFKGLPQLCVVLCPEVLAVRERTKEEEDCCIIAYCILRTKSIPMITNSVT
jgi:hypothetical protein